MDREAWPTPLRERPDDVGTAVRAYAQATERSETTALARGRRTRRLPLILVAAAAVLVCVPVLWTLLSRRPADVANQLSQPPETPPAPPPCTPSTAPVPVAPRVAVVPPPRKQTPNARNKAAPDPLDQATDESIQAAVAEQLRRAGHLQEALAAFEDQRTRFPNGVLRDLADQAIVELLVRLGRPAEALVESELGLARRPHHEQAAALHVLRGNIYRDVFGDQPQADREYGLARRLQP